MIRPGKSESTQILVPVVYNNPNIVSDQISGIFKRT